MTILYREEFHKLSIPIQLLQFFSHVLVSVRFPSYLQVNKNFHLAVFLFLPPTENRCYQLQAYIYIYTMIKTSFVIQCFSLAVTEGIQQDPLHLRKETSLVLKCCIWKTPRRWPTVKTPAMYENQLYYFYQKLTLLLLLCFC